MRFNLKIIAMPSSTKGQPRRQFLKGVLINSAVLTTIPIGVSGKEYHDKRGTEDDELPRLPLKIHLSSVIADSLRTRLQDLSPQLTISPRL